MGGGLAFDDPAKVLAALNSAIDASNAAATEGPPVASLVTPTESFAGFFKIKETTNAAYFQANMEGEVAGLPVRGNSGVRWFHTSLLATDRPSVVEGTGWSVRVDLGGVRTIKHNY